MDFIWGNISLALGALLLVLFGGGSFWDLVPLGGFRSPNWEELGFWQRIADQLLRNRLGDVDDELDRLAAVGAGG